MSDKSSYNEWLHSLSDEDLIEVAKKTGVGWIGTDRKRLLNLLTKGSSVFSLRARALFSERNK